MGTSQSKPNAPPAAPLIPPWANQDPPPPVPLPDPDVSPVPLPDPDAPPNNLSLSHHLHHPPSLPHPDGLRVFEQLSAALQALVIGVMHARLSVIGRAHPWAAHTPAPHDSRALLVLAAPHWLVLPAQQLDNRRLPGHSMFDHWPAFCGCGG